MAEAGERAPAAWPSRWRSSPRSRACWRASRKPLSGKRVLVTSGPTHEPIDPVRYIANRSSGKQGHAIAAAAARAGAEVTLVSRPGDPARSAGRYGHQGRKRARDAARSRARAAGRCRDLRRRGRRLARRQCRRTEDQEKPARPTPELPLIENPDILSTIAHRKIAAAAVGDRLCRGDRERRRQCQGQARAQRLRLDSGQRCVAANRHHGRRPQYHPARHARGVESWPPQSKEDVAKMLIARIVAEHLETNVSEIEVRIAPAARPRSSAAVLSERARRRHGPDGRGAGGCAGHACARRACLVPTGIAIALPAGTEGQVRPRSGLAAATGSRCSMRPARSMRITAARYRCFW